MRELLDLPAAFHDLEWFVGLDVEEIRDSVAHVALQVLVIRRRPERFRDCGQLRLVDWDSVRHDLRMACGHHASLAQAGGGPEKRRQRHALPAPSLQARPQPPPHPLEAGNARQRRGHASSAAPSLAACRHRAAGGLAAVAAATGHPGRDVPFRRRRDPCRRMPAVSGPFLDRRVSLPAALALYVPSGAVRISAFTVRVKQAHASKRSQGTADTAIRAGIRPTNESNHKMRAITKTTLITCLIAGSIGKSVSTK